MAKKSKYGHLSREQIEARLEKLEKEGYGLKWEDKLEAVADLCNTQLPVLKEDKSKEIISDPNLPTNYIIEGENYHSLFTLNFTHKKKIDVIYIDPPYNTGNKNEWKYNDHWVDENDTYRHSKWLSFMNKRLRLAKLLLKEEGVIFISIDDNEVAQLKLLCDKIFGEKNFVAIITRKQKATSNKGNFFSPSTDFILCYSKNVNYLQEFDDPYAQEKESYKKLFKHNDEKGDYNEVSLYMPSLGKRPNQRYYINCPDGSLAITPFEDKMFRWIETTYKKNLADNRVVFKKTKTSPLIDENGNQSLWNIYTKIYLHERNKSGLKPLTFIDYPNSTGTKELIKMGLNFSFSKPKELINFLIKISNKSKDITILDFFAGSGTTAHAVMELNKEDGGNRRFILCTNNENNICTEVSYPRVKKVIEGYADKEGIAANVKYFTQTFVNQVTSDKDKRELVNRSTELLCMAENTFDVISKRNTKNDFAIFGNTEKITAIIYDESCIEMCIDKLNQLNSGLPAIIYVFSYDHEYFPEDFKSLKIKFNVKPIPEAILNVYRKIAKLRKK